MFATTFSGGAFWWALTQERQTLCNLQVKTVWSMSERFETKRCIKALLVYKYFSIPFLFYGCARSSASMRSLTQILSPGMHCQTTLAAWLIMSNFENCKKSYYLRIAFSVCWTVWTVIGRFSAVFLARMYLFGLLYCTYMFHFAIVAR